MKTLYSLLAIATASASLVACGSGSGAAQSAGGNTYGPQAIIPPSITMTTQAHSATSAYYTASSNNPYYQAYTITNKGSKGTTLNSLSITGTNASEFAIKNTATLYPVAANICSSGMVLSANSSCEVMVGLTNPTTVSASKLTGMLSAVVAGIQYNATLSKSTYAYIAGNFSQAYPNTAESIAGTTPSGSGYCGVNNKQCQLLAYNLASKSISSILNSDYSVNNMAVGANGTIYAGGGLTTATAGSTTISEPGVGSLVLAINPALVTSSNGITDVISASGLSGTSNYPDGQIYSMAYNNNMLYLAGGFQNMVGISSPAGYPVVSYNTSSSAWGNIFTAGDPDLSVSAMGFANGSSNLYIAGAYSNLDGNNYNPTGIYGNFPLNECTTADGGATYTCSATDYVSTDATGNLDGMPQPAASITFDSASTMYTAGGFSKIGSVGAAASANYPIATSSSYSPLNSATWALSFLGSNYPNNVISAVTPFAVNQFLTGGFFSSIGGVAADANAGSCGLGALAFNGTQSCMVAQYNGTAFSEAFTTDGWINSIVYVNQIGS